MEINNKHKKLMFFALLLLAPMNQISTDIYITSMPLIKKYFNSTTATTQLSISLFILSFAISQLIYGNIADIAGKKKFIILGLSISLVGTILCYYSSNIYQFNLARIIQGIGIGSTSLYRAIIFDIFSGAKLKLYIAYLSSATIICLALAPVLGSYIEYFINWQACFLFFIIYTTITLITTLSIIPNDSKKASINLKQAINNCKLVISNKEFLIYTAVISVAFFNIIAWISSSAFILQTKFHLSTISSGWIMLYCGMIAAITQFINGKLSLNENLLIKIGLTSCLFSGSTILYLQFLQILEYQSFIICISFLMFGVSIIFPNAYKIGLQSIKPLTGTGNSIATTSQAIGGALSSMLIAKLNYNYISELGVMLVVVSLLALVMFIRTANPNLKKAV